MDAFLAVYSNACKKPAHFYFHLKPIANTESMEGHACPELSAALVISNG